MAFRWVHKLFPKLLAATFFLSCRQSTTISKAEQNAVISEVTDMLTSYTRDIKQAGIMAEVKYLDSSANFFWIPPGRSKPLSYKDIVAILKQSAVQKKIFDNSFDTLSIIPLSKEIAVYVGQLRSIITDTLGNQKTYKLAEIATVIKQNGQWKLLCGQTSLINNTTETKTQASGGLSFFAGKWDFKIWFTANSSNKPDISAKWTLEKSLDSVEGYTGKVELNGSIFTREIIAFNNFTKQYERTVITNSGAYITLKTNGWEGNKLTWLGSQNMAKQKTELKEEITKQSDNKFEAKFYQLQNNKWQLTQTEYLTKTHS